MAGVSTLASERERLLARERTEENSAMGQTLLVSDDDLDDVAGPNCPRDLVPMQLEGEADAVRWACPECGLVSVAS
jgi:hypothetical protein